MGDDLLQNMVNDMLHQGLIYLSIDSYDPNFFYHTICIEYSLLPKLGCILVLIKAKFYKI
jgi:hypothetical protein